MVCFHKHYYLVLKRISFALLFLLFIVPSFVFAQHNISGKWVSPMEADSSIVILHLEQNGDSIHGIGYKQFGDSIGSVIASIKGTYRNFVFEYNTDNIIEAKVDSIYSLCSVHGRDLLYIKKNRMILKGLVHSIDTKEECIGLNGREKYIKAISFQYKNTSFNNRKVLITDTIPVKKDSVTLFVYDHLQEDGDIISLYLNEQPVLTGYTLKNAKKEITIPITNSFNELIVYAYNLGSIPPNTVAVEIWQHQHLLKKVILQSDMNKSESIIFKTDIP